MYRSLRLGSPLMAVLALSACNDVPTAPLPAELVLVQAPSSVGAPGWELLDTLRVRAVDPDGTPRAGLKVTWIVRQGGGSISPTTDTTDADGLASAVWTLGATSGVNKARAITLEDAEVDFESTGKAFQVDRLVASSWMGCGLVGSELWCWAGWAWTPPPSKYPDYMYGDFSPGLVDAGHQFVDLAVSAQDVCGLQPLQGILCANYSHQQMDAIPGLPQMMQVVGGTVGGPAGSFCGLASADSTAWCWQLGGTPTQVPGSSGFTRLWMDRYLGTSTTCGLRADSTAACWGDGPLGDGTTGASSTPVAVGGSHQFSELAVGEQFACGRTTLGEVWCWGQGIAGGGLTDLVLAPALVATGARSIAATFDEAMLIGFDQSTFRWRGPAGRAIEQAVGLAGLLIEGFASNTSLACLRLADGQTYCWDEYWDATSAIPTERYSPVQPLRSMPVGVPRR